jgi:hypothetical protein
MPPGPGPEYGRVEAAYPARLHPRDAPFARSGLFVL